MNYGYLDLMGYGEEAKANKIEELLELFGESLIPKNLKKSYDKSNNNKKLEILFQQIAINIITTSNSRNEVLTYLEDKFGQGRIPVQILHIIGASPQYVHDINLYSQEVKDWQKANIELNPAILLKQIDFLVKGLSFHPDYRKLFDDELKHNGTPEDAYNKVIRGVYDKVD